MGEYKAYRIIDGKPKWVIINENGKIVNRKPSKDELKILEKELRKPRDTLKGKRRKYTDKELLEYLKQFYEENGRPPTMGDFLCNTRYPGMSTYVYQFGSWTNALKLVDLDVDTMIKNGVIENEYQKGRFAELLIRDHFKNKPIDLAGENLQNPYDGICPNGMIYDVKSSKFCKEGKYYCFIFDNIYKDQIEILYLLGFNNDYTELEHAWRIETYNFLDDEKIIINTKINSRGKYTIDNMWQYDITEKLKETISNDLR